MRFGKLRGWRSVALALGTLGVVSCSSASELETHYCSSDSECAPGQVCGTESGSGILHCLRVGCAYTPGGFTNPCGDGATSSGCSCEHATCQDPLDSCRQQLCPGVCKQGESCQFCFNGDDCDRVNPCFGSTCVVAPDRNAACRPPECMYFWQKPPQCGSPDSPCGPVCPTPNCGERQCGADPLTGASCGSCGAHHYCIDGNCRQDPQYLFCEGDLVAKDAEIAVEQVRGRLPLPAGGEIADGTYDLVAEQEYEPYSVSDIYYRGALRFTNGGANVEHIYDADFSSQADRNSPHRLMTVSADGTTLMFHVDCPGKPHVFFVDYTRGFSVVGDELWLIQRAFVEIYERRR